LLSSVVSLVIAVVPPWRTEIVLSFVSVPPPVSDPVAQVIPTPPKEKVAESGTERFPAHERLPTTVPPRVPAIVIV